MQSFVFQIEENQDEQSEEKRCMTEDCSDQHIILNLCIFSNMIMLV